MHGATIKTVSAQQAKLQQLQEHQAEVIKNKRSNMILTRCAKK